LGGRAVDGVLGHHAIGRELAARHDHEAGSGQAHRVLAREFGGGVGTAVEEWTQSRVHADDVLTRQRCHEQRVHVRQEIVDVIVGGERSSLSAL
jgi:hypothetical protein